MNSVMGRDIRVNKIDNNKFNCLISSNFKVYEHDISKSVVSYKYGSETVFGLRFFLHSGPNNSSNLKLYNKNTEPYSLEDYTKKWVTLQKVDNFSCGINTDNSKLLEVLLEEYNKALSKEHKNQFPRKVLSYYHINDLAYNYPLILVLEYQSGISNNSSDYYKLTRKIDPMKWEKMQNNNRDQFENNGDKEFLDEIQKFDNKLGQRPTENYDKNELNNVIGNKLKKIVENLGIDYTENSKGTNIPHSDKLNDSNSAAVAGTITTLSLAGAGGGFLFYKYQAIVMSFIRGLLH
ncbi:hypothetical protein MACJ_002677 [Theileria orientalis]|uniref:Uncharacterized protein n=1 Tax=Theileria orientalis TaxID=68886 RepID=A0A976M803_THEOR|nr:hypothetical protein MACJ_002677 [Theileria orientalis]